MLSDLIIQRFLKSLKKSITLQEDEAYAEMGEMMDPEDLEYLRKVHQAKLEKKAKKKKKEDTGDDEYESEVLQRHGKLKEEEESKKGVKALLPIRFVKF